MLESITAGAALNQGCEIRPMRPAIGLTGNESSSDPIVYVVDDESDVRRALGFFLKASGYSPRPFLSGSDLLAETSNLQPGCVLLDIRMPGVDGLEVLQRIGRQSASLPVIVMTGHGDIATAVRAMQLGAIDLLEKPFEDELLLKALGRGFDLIARGSEAERERREAARRLDALTAASATS